MRYLPEIQSLCPPLSLFLVVLLFLFLTNFLPPFSWEEYIHELNCWLWENPKKCTYRAWLLIYFWNERLSLSHSVLNTEWKAGRNLLRSWIDFKQKWSEEKIRMNFVYSLSPEFWRGGRVSLHCFHSLTRESHC